MSIDPRILAQSGILVEIDQARRYRVGDHCLLHFKVRNLTDTSGRLTMSIDVPGIELAKTTASIQLTPREAKDIRFQFTPDTPGEEMVSSILVELKITGERSPRLLHVLDHSVVFQVTNPGEAGGEVDLRGVTFEFDEHVGDVSIADLVQGLNADVSGAKFKFHNSTGDVKISDLVRKQDRDGVGNGKRGDWAPLELIPRPDGWVEPGLRREEGVRQLVLLERTPDAGKEHRYFLFAKRELRFGVRPTYYDTEREEDIAIPLVLRRLPCSSERRDSENLRKSRMISKFHGSFRLRDHVVCVRDPGSRNGMRLDGKPLQKKEWVPLFENFKLRLIEAETVLTLGGRIFYPSEPGRVLKLGYPLADGPKDSLSVGSEHPHAVDALRLERLDNATEHTYIQVFRKAQVGSRNAAIRLSGEGIEPRHASIVFHQGEWFVTSLNPTARTVVNGVTVRPEKYVPLVEAASVSFGTRKFMVGINRPQWMWEL